MSSRAGKKCQQCPRKSALCSKHVPRCTCAFCAAIRLQTQRCQYFCPNDNCITSALADALLLRLARCSCLRQEKLNQNTNMQRKPVSGNWELLLSTEVDYCGWVHACFCICSSQNIWELSCSKDACSCLWLESLLAHGPGSSRWLWQHEQIRNQMAPALALPAPALSLPEPLAWGTLRALLKHCCPRGCLHIFSLLRLVLWVEVVPHSTDQRRNKGMQSNFSLLPSAWAMPKLGAVRGRTARKQPPMCHNAPVSP